ncbi:von Willebrand factor type A [Elysia marginata]|uniref:von Willebrand factor type A n=1 Tax=Elysia marginata TaxID=1093978 RepID=A0AAV4FU47_9GAST|nr:von Willebrand factor type A [Elysia marginata]
MATNGTEVYIKLPTGRSSRYDTYPSQRIKALCEKVAHEEGVKPNQVNLKYQGKMLNPEKTVGCYGVRVETILKAEILVPQSLDIVICKDDGTPAEELVISNLEPVSYLFEEVSRKLEIPSSKLQIKVRQKLRQCCTRLLQDIPNIRISIIAQGDYCDSESLYAVRTLDLTSNVQSLVDFANNVPATSGGDSPECYELVLKKTQELDWSEDSAKALVVIGDLYPHPPSYTDQHISWRDELDVLTGLGVKVYGVQAGNNTRSGLFYQELATVSGGCYLNLGDMDVITDMFLAVCYNEGDENMLETFEQELVETGNMTNEKQNMFQQLRERPEAKATDTDSKRANNAQQEQLREAWWDFTLDTRQNPSYVYKADQDKWLPYDSREYSINYNKTYNT